MPVRRYRLDAEARLLEQVLIGGSPLRLFRLTEAGRRTVLNLGEPTPSSRLVAALLDADAIHPISGRPDTASAFDEADVTIVVPTLGVPPHPPVGAVIVDDGSMPPVPGATVRLERNSGPAAARNAGWPQVATPLVAFVDSDTDLPDGWLRPVLDHFDDDRVAAVAPRVVSRAGSTRLARYEAAESPLDLGDRPARVRPGSRISYVPAAALVCRTGALQECGGFDESLRFGEDVDLVWRLDAAGWWVRYEPASIVRHAPRTTWRQWCRQRIGYGTAAAPLGARHGRAVAPLRMSGWSLGMWGVGVGLHPLGGLLVGCGTAVALVAKLRGVPGREAFRLAWIGNLRAGSQIAEAVRRVWWPIVALVALRSRLARRTLVLSALAARHPIRLADDLAYSIGVWRGAWTHRTATPLLPDIRAWPTRSRTTRTDRAGGEPERTSIDRAHRLG